MVDILNHQDSIPWSCWITLEHIQTIRECFEILKFSFVHQEINKSIDFLTHLYKSKEKILLSSLEFPKDL